MYLVCDIGIGIGRHRPGQGGGVHQPLLSARLAGRLSQRFDTRIAHTL